MPGSSTVSAREQYKIDCAHTWEKTGGVLALAENEAQCLLTLVFLLVPNVDFYFYFSLCIFVCSVS